MSQPFTKEEAHAAFKWICRCLQDAQSRGEYLSHYLTDLAEDAAWLYGYYTPSDPERRLVWMVRDNGTHLTGNIAYASDIEEVFGPDRLCYVYDADLENNKTTPVSFEEAKAFLQEPITLAADEPQEAEA